ncbi:MAG: ABC transporter permease [Thiobacillaceae bacterium]|jgi:nickel transport protein|nr:ABC transporter permease [Thiobacillaceae bacterium]
MIRAAVLLTALALALPAHAHDLQYTVSSGQAVVVRLFYVDTTPFSFEAYEIYPEGEKLPVQVGRTDHLGRIAFLPDKAGRWRVKAISEDGHGLDFSLDTDAAATLASSDKPLYERYGRIVVGVALLLGLFGFLNLYVKRKRS